MQTIKKYKNTAAENRRTMIVNLLKYYVEVIRFKKMPTEQVRRQQLNRFKKLFDFAKENSVFYKNLYKEAGVYDLEINSLADIEKVPIINKDIIRSGKYGNVLTKPAASGDIVELFTSGSSGEPMRLYCNKETLFTSHIRVLYILREAARYNPFKKILLIPRHEENAKFQVEKDLSLLKIAQKLGMFRREIVSLYRTPDEIIEKIEQTKPYIIWSTPSAIEIVANRLRETGKSFQIPYFFSFAEAISSSQADKFYKYICKNLIDVYGVTESPTIGYEINRSGKKIVFSNTNFLELANKTKIEEKTIGKLVITNLINYVMPIIRYDMNDFSVELNDADFPVKTIGEIYGRMDDMLDFPDGTKLIYHQVSEMFMDFTECELYKFSQKGAGPIKLQLKINRMMYTQDEVNALAIKRWNKRFSTHPLVIEFVDKLDVDSRTGKFKCIEKCKN